MNFYHYFDPHEPPTAICPVCNNDCDDVYIGQMGDVVGCDYCLSCEFCYEADVTECPVCGKKLDTEMVFLKTDGTVVGCDQCISEYSAYDYFILEEY